MAFNNVRSINVPIAGLGINNGTIGYGEICDFLSRPETTYIYNERLQVPFAYNGYDLIAFENEKSLAVKCRYVNQQQFGGVMILALNFDDFDDKCNRNDVDGSSKSMQTDTGRRFPLHNSIYRTLQFGSLTRNHMYRL